MNDGIDKSVCSLQYVTIDDIVKKVKQCGRGALLGKLDIQSAYRIVPVHPEDRILLGMIGEDQLFVDAVLPFGLRSAPKIFNAIMIADALQWIIQSRGVEFIDHYLDEFVTVGRPKSDECKDNMNISLSVCNELGALVAQE